MRRAFTCLLILALALSSLGCSYRAPAPEKEAPAALSGVSGSGAHNAPLAAASGVRAETPNLMAAASSPVTEEKTGGFPWEGNWYGWWQSKNCTGQYEVDWEDARYDACAEIADGRMIVWDEFSPREDALAEFGFTPDGSSGSAVNGSGYFMDMAVSGRELTFTADGDAIRFTGRYETGKGAFDFEGMLRPWGDAWEGVDPEEMPVVFQKWYLPLIQNGVTVPPEDFMK